jgi:hypothetical protein
VRPLSFISGFSFEACIQNKREKAWRSQNGKEWRYRGGSSGMEIVPGLLCILKIQLSRWQWDNTSSSWQKVGDVVDAVGQGRTQSYEGKEYDYVFDVDIAEGAPPLKLPYNVTGKLVTPLLADPQQDVDSRKENPYSAAQRFLERNDLPMSYLDQVVQFIEKNTAGVTLGANNDFVDPFTGEFVIPLLLLFLI